MPVTKSAKKRMKTNQKRRARNLRVKSSLRTLIKNLNRTVELQKGEEARAAFLKVSSALDRAVSKGMVHKNAAARKKSRLAKKLNQLSAASSVSIS